MAKCRDGVELPYRGSCPMCGANSDQPCRGQAYAQIMAEKARQEDARQRGHDVLELEKKMQQRDQRLP